jgi:hypothetical protein
MSAAAGPVVNLYAQGTARVDVGGTPVTITQATEYPVGDEIVITLGLAEPLRFTLRLRIPPWSGRTVLAVNGDPIACRPGSYAALDRAWKDGDQIVLRLELRGRAVPSPSGSPDLAVMRGPIVLALDSRLVQPQATAVRLVQDAEGFVELKPAASKPEEIWMAYEVPFEVRPWSVFDHYQTTLTMCDFASAGNRWSEDNTFRTWLPQPLFLNQLVPPQIWKLMHPVAESRPRIPGVIGGTNVVELPGSQPLPEPSRV